MIHIVNYVYSVIDCPQQKSFGSSGLKGEEVLTVPCEDISAVVSRIQTNILLGSIIEPNEANWLKHDEVVRGLMNEHTVIPVKFGSLLKSDRDLKMMLRRLLPECRAELKRLKDKIEVGVKILADQGDIMREASREPGAVDKFRFDILRARSMMVKGRRVLLGESVRRHLDSSRHDANREGSLEKIYYAKKLYDMLAEPMAEGTANQLLSPDMVLNASFLLDRNRIETFQTKLSELKQFYSRFEFLISGPWAPYNFTRVKYY